MNSSKIIWYFLTFFLIYSVSIFFVGLIETTRNESIGIGDTLLLNVTNTSSNAWVSYEEFKSSYVFTNEPLIYVLNFMGMSGLLYLIFFSWNMGRKSIPLTISEVFTQYSIVLILLLYILSAIFNYLYDIFVNQLILILFIEIYSELFVYQLLSDWFFGFLLFALFISWLGNQLKYFDKVTPF